MASSYKNIEYIKKHFDTYSDFILKKLEEDNISLSNRSNSFVSNIGYIISNYIDFVNNRSTDGLENLTFEDIKNLYQSWVEESRKTFTTKNYTETNDIIIDYRINNIGFYWVDLNTYYSSEMLFRMNNCARINSYQNILELREYTTDDYNYSRVAVAINKDGNLNQIRGDNNLKADMIYRDYIYDLFLNYGKITGFKFLFTKESDFTHMDLTKKQLENLRNVRPELFNLL